MIHVNSCKNNLLQYQKEHDDLFFNRITVYTDFILNVEEIDTFIKAVKANVNFD